MGLISQSLTGAQKPAETFAKTATKQAVSETALKRSRELLSLTLHRLDEEQANDVVNINLSGKSDIADSMIIASGRSQRHVGAIADKLAREMKEAGFGMPSIEGMPACDWVLLDAGDVVVHLFRPEVREFYNLERIWAPELYEDKSGDIASFTPQTDAVTVTDGGA